MSIVKLKKITLVALAAEKAELLDDLQTLGCIHLIPLGPEGEEAFFPRPTVPEEAYAALKYLRDCPRRRHPVLHGRDFHLPTVVDEVLQNCRRVREVSDLRDFIVQRIRDLAPWGDFVLPPLEDLAGCRLWFYRVPMDRLHDLPRGEVVWQVVHQDHRFAYVVVVAREEPADGVMPVPRVHTGSVPLNQLRLRLNEVELELEDLLAEREYLTRWVHLIRRNLARTEDEEMRTKALSMTLDHKELFALGGWVPARAVSGLEDYAARRGLALSLEEPAPSDRPPTLLELPEPVAAGEDLVRFYQLPAYRGWDPSAAVVLSFTLFFAMILSDAGYGAVLGFLLLLFRRPLLRSPKGRRLRVLAAWLAFTSIAWGVLVGSYFGMAPPEGSLPAQLRLFDLTRFDTMMAVSVGVGIFHLAAAFVAQAANAPSRREAALFLGWLGVMVGAVSWWLTREAADFAAVAVNHGAMTLAVAGAVAVLVTGGRRPLQRPRDALIRLWEGLAEITRVTRLFGDMLSYLRLFALGLASASLALTFNGLAQQSMQSQSGLGILLGLLILAVGHLINLALSIMSGVVHGLRLNFIEFYNWGLSEEGYPFRPFEKREKKG